MAKKSVFEDVYMQVSPEGLQAFEQAVLPQALAGDYEALTRVWYVCSEAMRQGLMPPPGLIAYMSDGLRAMADGTDSREAWQVKRKRGEKDTSLAYWNATHRAFFVEMKRADGATYEEAVNQVAKAECVSTDTVELAWKKHHRKIIKDADGRMRMPTGPLLEEGG